MTLAALANHVWQSTLFALAVGALTLALRRNRAAVRYALWLASSIKFRSWKASLRSTAAAFFIVLIVMAGRCVISRWLFTERVRMD